MATKTLYPTSYLTDIGRTTAASIMAKLEEAGIKPVQTMKTKHMTYRLWDKSAVQFIKDWRARLDAPAPEVDKPAIKHEDTVIETIAQPESNEQRFKALADALGQALTDFTVARNDLVTLRTEQTEIRRLLTNILEVVTRPAPQQSQLTFPPIRWVPETPRKYEFVGGPGTAVRGVAAQATFSNGQLEAVAGNVDG